MAREAVIAAIHRPAAQATLGPVVAAVALRAVLPQTSALTLAGYGVMQDWLDRIAAG